MTIIPLQLHCVFVKEFMMGAKRIDLTGMRFGRLLVEKELSERNKHGHIMYLCLCDCGRKKKILGSSIRYTTRSCGCLQKETATKHSMEGTATYKTWIGMKSRCYNKEDKRYPYWGGRGISICDDWINDFSKFLEDMGEKPKGKTIERIDNDLGYSRDNCKWATAKEQANNRRSGVRVLINGEKITMEDYAKLVGLSVSGARKKASREFKRVNGVFIKDDK